MSKRNFGPPEKMRNKVFALISLLAFLAMTFSQAVILTSFMVNRAYIAKNLCENRSRPIMHCGGKCCLAKKLRNEQKRDQENPERRSESKFDVLALAYRTPVSLSLTEVFLHHTSHYLDTVTEDYRPGCFHPPQA